jgi:hypothetical protein
MNIKVTDIYHPVIEDDINETTAVAALEFEPQQLPLHIPTFVAMLVLWTKYCGDCPLFETTCIGLSPFYGHAKAADDSVTHQELRDGCLIINDKDNTITE